jgi:hypothetical protein
MRVDRNAAPVVVDREITLGVILHLDPAGVALDRLVHGVVHHLGEEVVQRLLVGPADIHAGPAAHRLEPLEHLDRRRRVGFLGAAGLFGHGRPLPDFRHSTSFYPRGVP